MKDLMKYVAEVERDLDSIGVRYRTVRRWSVNTRAKKRWGDCRSLGGGTFDISISARLLADDADEQALRDTVAHELLHTVEGCFGHRGKWKALAERVTRELAGYTIARTTSAEAKGFEPDVPTTPREPVYRYALRCERCGQVIRRQKASKVILYPWRYRCTKCGGRFRRTEPGD